jgi:beta-N-acetylhexosaminidase
MAEMLAVAAEAPLLAGGAARRADAALAMRKPPAPIDPAASRAQFATLLRDVWQPEPGFA